MWSTKAQGEAFVGRLLLAWKAPVGGLETRADAAVYMKKLVLFSDLHLDAQFGWADPDVARKRRRILKGALETVMRLASEAKADAVLCGGDLYEHERFSPDTARFISSTFEQAHPLPVYIAPGNHDWYGAESIYRQTDWSPNVHIFESGVLQPVELTDGLTVWGAAHRAPANTSNFLDRFRVDRGGTNLALFHGSENGGFAWQGEGKAPHAPFRAEQIQSAGLDHALLGHYHHPNDGERFTYPGNLAPLTFGEKGDRGAVVFEIAESGSVTRRRHRASDQQIFDIALDVTGCTNSQEIRERASAAVSRLNGIVRLTLEGEVGAELDFRPGDLADVAPHMEGVFVRVGAVGAGYDFEAIAKEPTVRGQFVRDVETADLPAEERRRVLVTGLRALDGRNDLEVI